MANARVVLIVCDEKMIVRSMRHCLRDLSAEVQVSYDGKEALAMLQDALRPTGIITDREMSEGP